MGDKGLLTRMQHGYRIWKMLSSGEGHLPLRNPETSQAVKFSPRRETGVPQGPKGFINYWWNCGHALHDGVAQAFWAISKSKEEYSGLAVDEQKEVQGEDSRVWASAI